MAPEFGDDNGRCRSAQSWTGDGHPAGLRRSATRRQRRPEEDPHGVVRLSEQSRVAVRAQRLTSAGPAMRPDGRSASSSTSTTRRTRMGFTSWNDFFTAVPRRRASRRRTRRRQRHRRCLRVHSVQHRTGVKRRISSGSRHSLSLADMLADDEVVEEFVGGTVYQAFLSATNSPGGTARSREPSSGVPGRGQLLLRADALGSDVVLQSHSQATFHVAARAVFLSGPIVPPSDWWVSCRSACQRSAPVSSTRASSPDVMSPRARSSGTSSSELHPLPRLRTSSDRRLRDDRDPPTHDPDARSCSSAPAWRPSPQKAPRALTCPAGWRGCARPSGRRRLAMRARGSPARHLASALELRRSVS